MTETEDYENRLNQLRMERKRKNLRLAIIIPAILLLCLFVACLIYLSKVSYKGYSVIKTFDDESVSSTDKYQMFGNDLIMYNNDGIQGIGSDGNSLWSQAYDMQSPMLDICGGYLCIADSQGKEIFVIDSSGNINTIKVSMEIEQLKVSSVGTVIAVLDDGNKKYLTYYDKEGTLLAQGTVQMKKSGFPMDIDLSYDGKMLAVSYLYITTGQMQTNVAFYNFDSVGKSEIDNIVSSYSYRGIMIPDIEFMSNGNAVMFGDDRIIIYNNSEKPTELLKIDLDKEVSSIFYSDKNFGIATKNHENGGTIVIYNADGKEKSKFNTDLNFDAIEFDKNTIIAKNSTSVRIYRNNGKLKFSYDFEDNLYNILSVKTLLPVSNYLLVTRDSIQKISLR
ncbi:hypothetical protein SAMN05216249_109111 [Acetitomaculum ruminis DSM 5522]|uniref:Uncharacterized protein n=1 Tax=Acetitomaculum ruminis DSM 5522 TaxID=1120918 RepID=A0A1I0YCL4_9FIRM|nr:DUF5711 family protein [Acetitomaculum ruminis]SFB11135.1 hypothetical protein SAMN05216249_109111 [Acetitomaculum ruminis DSM 5522]